MNRALAFVVSLLFVPQVFTQAATASDPAAATPANTKPRISVIVSLTGKSGAPVAEFPKDAVTVLDNGEAAETLDLRSATPVPVHLAIVLMASKAGFAQEQAAAIDLVRKALRPNLDKAFVITAGGSKPWTNSRLDWQSDPAALEKSIKELDKSVGLPDAFNFDLEISGAGTSRMALQKYNGEGGPNNAFNVVWMMMQTDPRPARRAVVIFRDPWKHSNGFHDSYSKQVANQINDLVAQAQQMRASFFVVGLEESVPNAAAAELGAIYQPTYLGEGGATRVYDQAMQRAREQAYASGRVNLERLSGETGGKIWYGGKKNYSDVVEGISNELAGQYVLTFVPKISAPAPEHKLKVESRRSEVHIAAPKAFWIPVRPAPAK